MESKKALQRFLEVLKRPIGKKSYKNQASVAKEYKTSRNAFETSRQVTKTIMDDVVLGNAINTAEAKKTVEVCVDSILRNESVMLWMTKSQ